MVYYLRKLNIALANLDWHVYVFYYTSKVRQKFALLFIHNISSSKFLDLLFFENFMFSLVFFLINRPPLTAG